MASGTKANRPEEGQGVQTGRTRRKMLGAWLYAVALLRLISVAAAFSGNVELLHEQLFSLAPTAMTALHGRTFGTWTLTTCGVCILCARDGCNPDSAIFHATGITFLTAMGHFVTEVLVYRTMTWANFASPGLVAGISLLWLAAEYARASKLKQKL
mmetsp:Transcript_22861/g.76761  ORF Transcript_22861/g.76761 Transcript_22861/m.76761 type:complete len:156 (-) Transcript_22861:145-612(-)